MKCDFHIHTHYSYDSTSSPQQIVDVAVKKGINCLAITDHHEVKGAVEISRYARPKSILIIPGIEIKSRKGDILGLNVKAKIPDGLPVRKTIKKIKEQGGIVIIPHPFSTFTPFKGRLEEFLDEIDGIEVLNGSIFKRENKRALDFAKKNNLCFTAGSDAHFPNFVGCVYLEIPGSNLSIEEVLGAVKDKNGRLGGEEINLFEKIADHTKRNIAKIKKPKYR